MLDIPGFNHLYLTHLGEIQRFLRNNTRSNEIARELANEVFIRRWSTDTHVLNERAFLFRLAKNLVTDYFRRQIKHGVETIRLEDCEDLCCPLPGPERQMIGRQQLKRLQEAINELPLHSREVFIAYKFEGLSLAQLADLHKVTTSAIEKMLARALVKLRLKLEL